MVKYIISSAFDGGGGGSIHEWLMNDWNSNYLDARYDVASLARSKSVSKINAQ